MTDILIDVKKSCVIIIIKAVDKMLGYCLFEQLDKCFGPKRDEQSMNVILFEWYTETPITIFIFHNDFKVDIESLLKNIKIYIYIYS